jgi:hypothetical protein
METLLTITGHGISPHSARGPVGRVLACPRRPATVNRSANPFAPGGSRSLSKMINCSVLAICTIGSQLMLEQIMRADDLATLPAEWKNKRPSPKEAERIGKWIGIAEAIAQDFECKAALDRIEIIRSRLSKGISQSELGVEIRVLRETLDSGFKHQYVYRYPTDKSQILANWKNDWEAVIKAFPSAAEDVVECVDLWAMSHPTASVFHAMRILEHGLRALAKHVGRTFDIQNWQNIIDEIESEIRERSKKLPRGQEKNEKLKFLSEAAKEFTYFKDGWRNYVSHNRSNYDEHQARSVYEHVRAFMTVLSSQLKETSIFD